MANSSKIVPVEPVAPPAKQLQTPWVVFLANAERIIVQCNRCRARLSFPDGYRAHKAEDAMFMFRWEHKDCPP